MQLRDVMTANVQVINPDANLQDAARLMKDLDIGALPICDGDRLRGFVTDRDITIRAVAEGKDPTTCKVSDVMTGKVFWCYEDEDLESAGNLMREHQIRRLAILNRDKRLVGIVSLGDLAVEGEDEDFAGGVLEAVSEPTHEAST